MPQRQYGYQAAEARNRSAVGDDSPGSAGIPAGPAPDATATGLARRPRDKAAIADDCSTRINY